MPTPDTVLGLSSCLETHFLRVYILWCFQIKGPHRNLFEVDLHVACYIIRFLDTVVVFIGNFTEFSGLCGLKYLLDSNDASYVHVPNESHVEELCLISELLSWAVDIFLGVFLGVLINKNPNRLY